MLKHVLNFKLSQKQQTKVVNSVFSEEFNEDEINSNLYMSLTQLKQLANEGMLGSHGHSHAPMGYLSPHLIEEE